MRFNREPSQPNLVVICACLISGRRLSQLNPGVRFLKLSLRNERGDKPIALTDDRLDELRVARIVSQCLPDFADGGIDAALGVQK